MATAYKVGIHEHSKFIISYSINKIDFLKIYGSTREKVITPLNIKKAWKTAGLESLDSEVILKQLPARLSVDQPTTSLSTVTYTGSTGEAVYVLVISANVVSP